MAELLLSRKLPYPAPALFDLVADVERYPKFLPYFIEARIERRTPHALRTVQTVGVAGLRFSFRSLAILRRPGRLTVRSRAFPFRYLNVHWQFMNLPSGCKVTLKVSYEMHARWIEIMVQPWVRSSATHLAQAFVRRARILYGDGRTLE